jgi:hypothetical protein
VVPLEAIQLSGAHKFRVVTFADGHPIWRRSLERFRSQVERSSLFSGIDVYDMETIEKEIPEFFNSHQAFINANKRGFGYWLWKPAIVKHSLRRLTADELGVIYIDVGCTISSAEGAKRRLAEYLELCILKGGLFFRLNGDNRIENWMKRDVQEYFALSETELRENGFVGGIFALLNNQGSLDFLDEWLEVMTKDSYHFTDDSPSVNSEYPEFIEHRHDQSVLAGLLLKRRAFYLADETYVNGSWKSAMSDVPILATRTKSKFPTTSKSVIWKVIRKLEFILVGLGRDGIA